MIAIFYSGLPPRPQQHHSSRSSRDSRPPPPAVPGQHSTATSSTLGLPLAMSKSYGNLSVGGGDDNKENFGATVAAAKLEGSQSLDILEAMAKENEKISVKERTKTFNRMASETDVGGGGGLGASNPSLGGSLSNLNQRFAAGQSAVKRRNSRAVDLMMGGVRRSSTTTSIGSRGDDEASHDSASINTIDPVLKSWMVLVSKGNAPTEYLYE